MKPILPYSILLSIAISPLALATDYGQILNYNGIVPNDGIVNVTASAGSTVQVSANGRTTTLQGNVTVTNTGYSGYAIYLNSGSGYTSSINVNNVTSDVNVYVNGGGEVCGIYHTGNGVSSTSKITIDTGNYNLNVKRIVNATGQGTGVLAYAGGKIDITAKNVTVDHSSTGASWGVYASGAGAIINIVAQEKVTVKAGRYVVLADGGGILNITGDLDAASIRKTDGIGVYATGSSSAVTVDGHTDVSGQAQYGVQAQNKGTVTLKGGLTVDQTDLGATYAVLANGGTVTDGIANGAAGTTYDVSGQMRAQTLSGTVGTIDLHMGADSIFTGYTTKVSAADVIKLELSTSAEWALATASSSLTSLSVTQGSALTIASGNTFLITASEGITLGSGSYINMSDARANMDGTVLTLFNTASTVTDGTNVKVVGLVGDQWYSYDYTYSETTKKYTIGSGMSPIDVPEFREGVTPIPEPTTASLTLLGLASLMMRRRRLTA